MPLDFVEQTIWGLSRMNRYSPTHFSQGPEQDAQWGLHIASQRRRMQPVAYAMES